MTRSKAHDDQCEAEALILQSLVRKLVEMHGGRALAHSKGPGRGSEFVVRLPLLREAASQAAVEPMA